MSEAASVSQHPGPDWRPTPPPFPGPSDAWCFFLDVDGTLIDLAPTPDAVEVAPALISTLSALSERAAGAVALVSGRARNDVAALFRPLELPIAGQHGLEIGGTDAPAPDLPLLPEDLKAKVAAFSRTHPGLLFEDKGHAIAFHYRALPRFQAEAQAFMGEIADAAGDAFQLLAGKMVFEVKPKAMNKGLAIESFMTRAPFKDRRPVMIGDDVTDEDAFAAVNALDGLSIRVADGSDPDGSSTAARYGLKDPAAVRTWLGRYAAP